MNEIEQLRKENAEMLLALRPFALLAELFDPENRGANMPGDDADPVMQWPRLHKTYELTVGHLRAAREAHGDCPLCGVHGECGYCPEPARTPATSAAGQWRGSLSQIICDVPLPARNDKYQHGFVDAKQAILQALRDAGFDRAAAQGQVNKDGAA